MRMLVRYVIASLIFRLALRLLGFAARLLLFTHRITGRPMPSVEADDANHGRHLPVVTMRIDEILQRTLH